MHKLFALRPLTLRILVLLAVAALPLSSSRAAAPAAPAGAPGLTTRFWSAPGTSFTPGSSQSTWSSSAYGCRWEPGSSPAPLALQRGLELPDGAHITGLELDGYDANAGADMQLKLTVAHPFNDTGVDYPLASGGSSGGGSWSMPLDLTVDNYNFIYILSWNNNAAPGANLKLCSAIVSYEVPITSALLPALYNSGP